MSLRLQLDLIKGLGLEREELKNGNIPQAI